MTDLLIELSPGKIWSQSHCKGAKLYVERGSLWLTEAGDSRDFLLTEISEYVVQTDGQIVVQALTDSVIRIDRLGEEVKLPYRIAS